MRNRKNSRCTLQLVHSNRCSNHNLGSSSWRKIIVVISDFPINFCFTFFSLFLYSVLKVLGGFATPLVGSNGLEPSTSRLSGVRSNHLSYEPISVAGSFPIGQTFASASHRLPCAITVFPFVQTAARLGSAPRRGGDEQNRTVDPLLARQVLSQLSYAPV